MEAIFDGKHLVLGVGDVGELRRESTHRRSGQRSDGGFNVSFLCFPARGLASPLIPRAGGGAADGTTVANTFAQPLEEKNKNPLLHKLGLGIVFLLSFSFLFFDLTEADSRLGTNSLRQEALLRSDNQTADIMTRRVTWAQTLPEKEGITLARSRQRGGGGNNNIIMQMFIVSGRTSAFNRYLLPWPLRRTSTCENPTGAPHSAQYCEFVRKCAKSLRQFSPIFFPPLTKKLCSQEQFIEEKIDLSTWHKRVTQQEKWHTSIFRVWSHLFHCLLCFYWFIYLLLLLVSGVILDAYRESWAAAASWQNFMTAGVKWKSSTLRLRVNNISYCSILESSQVEKNLSNLSACPSRYHDFTLPDTFPTRSLMLGNFFFIYYFKEQSSLTCCSSKSLIPTQ